MARIDEFIKGAFHVAFMHPHSGQFNDGVVHCRQSGGLHVKHDISGISQWDRLRIIGNRYPVIHDIGFHTVKNFYPGFFSGVMGIRKPLCATMIGDRNRLMAPLASLSDKVCHIVGCIHRTHIRMQVKFDPFFAFRCIIFAGLVFDFQQILRIHNEISHKSIFLNTTTHFDPTTFSNGIKDLFIFFIIGEFFHTKRRRIVGDFQNQNLPF